MQGKFWRVTRKVFVVGFIVSSLTFLFSSSPAQAFNSSNSQILLASDVKLGDTIYNTNTEKVNSDLGLENVKSQLQLLPGWRWGGATTRLWTAPGNGFSDISNTGLTTFASLFFIIASWLWSLILWAGATALSADFITDMAAKIDNVVSTITDTLLIGPAWIVLAIGVLTAVYAVAVRDNVSAGIRKILTPVIAFAAMIAISGAVPIATLAVTISGFIDSAVGSTAGQLARINVTKDSENTMSTEGQSASTTAIKGNLTTENKMSCDGYSNVLYDQYAKAISGDKRNNSSSGRENLVVLSYLWQRSVQDPYTIAQFGNSDNATDSTCHQLEQYANVPVAEQIELSTLAAKNKGVNIAPLKPENFMEHSDKKDITGYILAWQACKLNSNGSWSVMPDSSFGVTGTKPGETFGWGEKGTGRLPSDWCEKRANTGSLQNKLAWGSSRALLGDVSNSLYGDNKPGAESVGDSVQSWWGHNADTRLVSGITTLITAVVYVIGLGGVLLGALVAQIGLVLLLMWMPFVLLLYAIGGAGNKRFSQTAGGRILKLTMGFFGAKVAAVIVITLILQATALTISLLS